MKAFINEARRKGGGQRIKNINEAKIKMQNKSS